MYPEIASTGYRQHISTADTYWRGRDLMLSSTRSTPKHFSLCSRLARIQIDTSSKQADTKPTRALTSLADSCHRFECRLRMREGTAGDV